MTSKMLSMGETLNLQHGSATWRSRSRSLTSPDQCARSHRSHQNSAWSQRENTGYFWIFRSPMKLRFQQIKNQDNRRFLQADMVESPKVARAENSKHCWSETAIAPSFGLRLRRRSTYWKGNFINFSVELYFGICSVLDVGVNPWRRGSNNAMTTRMRTWTWCQ